MRIGWPQGIALGLLAIGLLLTATLDGEERTGKHSLSLKILSSCITLGILWWGGFFG